MFSKGKNMFKTGVKPGKSFIECLFLAVLLVFVIYMCVYKTGHSGSISNVIYLNLSAQFVEDLWQICIMQRSFTM